MCVCVWKRERENKRKRQINRQTHRLTDGQSDIFKKGKERWIYIYLELFKFIFMFTRKIYITLNIYIYIYIYICVCVCVCVFVCVSVCLCIYIYIYIYVKRERYIKKEGKRLREREISFDTWIQQIFHLILISSHVKYILCLRFIFTCICLKIAS